MCVTEAEHRPCKIEIKSGCRVVHIGMQTCTWLLCNLAVAIVSQLPHLETFNQQNLKVARLG